MASTKIDLNALDAEAVASLIAQVKEREEAAKNEAKAKREQGKALTRGFLAQVVADLPRQIFTSGAEGYSLGGKFEHAGVTYRVSVLVRDEATIPDKE